MINHQANIEYIEKKANNFATSKGLLSEDLYSYLIDKYLQILKNFDPEKSIPFENYMKSCLNGYCLNFIRDIYLKGISSSNKKIWMEFNSLKRSGYSDSYIENYLGFPLDILKQKNKQLNNQWNSNHHVGDNTKSNLSGLSYHTLCRLEKYIENQVTPEKLCEKEKYNLEIYDYCD